MTFHDAMLLVFLASWIGSLFVVMIVPGMMKRAHVRRQNRLLERCRALYVLAVEAVGLGDDATARGYLKRIRRIESHWRFGNSWPYRIAFAFWAIGVAAAAYMLLRAGVAVLVGLASLPNEDHMRRISEAVPVFLFLAALGAMHGMAAFFSAWTDRRLVDDCGDRLERILNAGCHVAIVSEEDEWRRFGDCLTPEQILGLGLTFTRRQLDRARRRLVAKLHPDRWHSAGPAVRRAREEALKRVNAAYDLLRPRAA
jgi:hypothetical protein